MNTCIFCLEGGNPETPLLYNVKCRCNYYFHMSCYNAYRTPTVCPLCRSTVGELWIEEYDEPTVIVPEPSAPQIVYDVSTTTTTIELQQLQQSQQSQQQQHQSPSLCQLYIYRAIFSIACLLIFIIILLLMRRHLAD